VEVCGGQVHDRDGLPPDKETPLPILQEAGWAPQPVWTR